MPDKPMSWTVYFNPSDFPDQYVVRRFELDQPQPEGFASENYIHCIEWLQKDSQNYNQGVPTKIMRQPEDDPVILETWI